MKILSAEQIKEGDLLTIQREPISSINLMERAAKVVFSYLEREELHHNIAVSVFCGVGNNGGDGLVIARLLLEKGFQVTVYVVNFKESYSPDFKLNLERLNKTDCKIITLFKDQNFPIITQQTLVIDAIFGVGLNRKPEPWVQNIISYINQYSHRTISIDLPSGLYMHKKTDKDQVVKAHVTLSFQVPKLVFFLKDSAPNIGQWKLLDIGINQAFLNEVSSPYLCITKTFIKEIYKPREAFTHKGTFGHGLIIGGEYGKIGAVLLSAKACLHSGAGLVRVFVPSCGYIPLQTAIPEIMVMTDVREKHLTLIPTNIQATAIGIGPGMGTHPETIHAFQNFLKQINKPLVVDADGLNCLAKQPELIEYLSKETILTPHPKELERLIGPWDNDFDLLEKTQQFANKHQLIVLIKGAFSKIVYADKVYINTTGNQGMATAGSGDVLTGLITGLLAQNYSPLDATILGVYLHGLSGDFAYKAHKNYHTITASSLIEYLPKALDFGFAQST